MGQRDREEIRSSLLQKGFKEKGNDHDYFFLYINGKKQPIFTFLSRGSNYKSYGNPLLAKMSRQLKLTKQELLDLIDCDLNGEKYIEKLKERGSLSFSGTGKKN